MDRQHLAEMLKAGSRQPGGTRFRQVSFAVIAAAVVDAAVVTLPVGQRNASLVALSAAAIWCFFLFEWVLRLGLGPEIAPGTGPWVARRNYALSPAGIVDALSVLGPLVIV